ncbi:MAG: hypothetical protein ACREQ5_15720, partial [Candidatus Dormibacteria bacterium]
WTTYITILAQPDNYPQYGFHSPIGTGSPSGNQIAQAAPVDVVPGQVWNAGAYVDATQVTSGSIGIGILDVTHGVEIASAVQGVGIFGHIATGSFTIPAGCTQILFFFATNNATITSGGAANFAQPMLNVGSTLLPYQPNFASPPMFGLVSSAQTTLDAHGDRWQDVKYAAIEPDWNAAAAEANNALANALRQNIITRVAIDQYIVDALAYPGNTVPFSGLTLEPPVFHAIFAAGSSPVTYPPGGGFPVPISTTTWVWFDPNLTWTLNNTPVLVAGSILYAIVQTNATTIIGVTPKAPIGVIEFSALPIQITKVIDANGNVLATDFPGQLVQQTSGAYAGFDLMAVATVKDPAPATLALNFGVWMQWTAWYPLTGTFGYGPCWTDSGGNVLLVDANSGSGDLFINSTPLITLQTNSLNDGKPHTFLALLRSIAGAGSGNPIWSVLCYADGKLLVSWTGPIAFTQPFYPGFRADTANSVGLRDFSLGIPGPASNAKNLILNGTFSVPSNGTHNSNPPDPLQLVP